MPDFPERSTSTPPYPNGNLEELQELLFAAERKRLNDLEDRLRNSVVEATAERKRLDQLEGDLNHLDDHIKNKVIDAPAVANVLPDAIRQRTKQDRHLEKSLEPIIGNIFVRSIKGSSRLIADTIIPEMIPAIRKAIETAVQDIVQSVNRTLDYSGLSWRGITWRWEAWRTSRSFGEVLLSHTFGYQVERVFLFFREDGIHLADVRTANVPAFESGHEDLITSMFSKIKTAVQKFAQDEFQASKDSSMKEIKMDDGKTVLIEQGQKAVVAAVVRGSPSPLLRPKLQDALDSIHFELNEALQTFRGDKQPFEAARPHLESCLLQEENDSRNETGSTSGGWSPAFVVTLMLLLSALGWWGVTNYLDQRRVDEEQLRWAHFLEKARGKPGIQITHTQTADGKNGKTIVYGLRDPLSYEPQKIAQEVGLSAEAIDFRLEPYLSLAPELLNRRTRERLNQLVQEIEAHHFDFEAGSASLASEAEPAFRALLQALRESDALAQQLGYRMRVEIHGNTSEEGAADTNRRLALARIQRILSTLTVERFPAIDFQSVAESVERLGTEEIQGSNPLRQRRVSFQVAIKDAGLRGAIP